MLLPTCEVSAPPSGLPPGLVVTARSPTSQTHSSRTFLFSFIFSFWLRINEDVLGFLKSGFLKGLNSWFFSWQKCCLIFYFLAVWSFCFATYCLIRTHWVCMWCAVCMIEHGGWGGGYRLGIGFICQITALSWLLLREPLCLFPFRFYSCTKFNYWLLCGRSFPTCLK